MSMKETAPVESEKQERLAEISRDMWADYLTRFRPVEDDLIGSINNPVQMSDALDRVDQHAATAHRTATSDAKYRSGRYGGMTDEQRQEMSRRMGLSEAKSSTGATNITRDHINDRDMVNLATLNDVGRNVRSGALGAFQTSANMEASRNSTNANIAASNTAGNWGLAGAAGAAAIMMA